MSARSLALQVALRLDTRDPALCAAWLEKADRVCGKPSVQPWLCGRHVAVAQRRQAKERSTEEAQAAAARERAERARPRKEARLAAIDRRLRSIDPLYGGITGGADRAAQHAPLRQRLPSDTRIAELAKLHTERERLESDLNPQAEIGLTTKETN